MSKNSLDQPEMKSRRQTRFVIRLVAFLAGLWAMFLIVQQVAAIFQGRVVDERLLDSISGTLLVVLASMGLWWITMPAVDNDK